MAACDSVVPSHDSPDDTLMATKNALPTVEAQVAAPVLNVIPEGRAASTGGAGMVPLRRSVKEGDQHELSQRVVVVASQAGVAIMLEDGEFLPRVSHTHFKAENSLSNTVVTSKGLLFPGIGQGCGTSCQ